MTTNEWNGDPLLLAIRRTRRRQLWRAGIMTAALLLLVIGLPVLLLAGTATITAPDAVKSCDLVTAKFDGAGNAEVYVDGCSLDSDESPPVEPPPPVDPPPPTGDPGGVWNPSPSLTVFSFAPGQNRAFVPGCIQGQDWHTGCPYSGSLQYGHTYAARFPVVTGGMIRLTVARAEAGEASAAVSGYASALPGARSSQAAACNVEPYSQTVVISDRPVEAFPGATFPSCVLPAGMAYLSFTPTDPRCGAGGTICRVQVVQ